MRHDSTTISMLCACWTSHSAAFMIHPLLPQLLRVADAVILFFFDTIPLCTTKGVTTVGRLRRPFFALPLERTWCAFRRKRRCLLFRTNTRHVLVMRIIRTVVRRYSPQTTAYFVPGMQELTVWPLTQTLCLLEWQSFDTHRKWIGMLK